MRRTADRRGDEALPPAGGKAARTRNGTDITQPVGQRWAVRFTVDGDVRFLSHHETLRALELAAGRAGLPLKYSQGFNPHPILSLPSPRPVGVSSRRELLVLSLEAPRRAEEVRDALAAQVPPGLRVLDAEPLTSKGAPRPRRADYALPLHPVDVERVQVRLAELRQAPAWPVERWTSSKGRRRGPAPVRTVDIKPMIADLAVEADRLRWSAVPAGDTWARPGDVLKLLGLDERALAEVVRTAVDYSDGAAGGPRWGNDESAGAGEAPRPIDNNPITKVHACKREC